MMKYKMGFVTLLALLLVLVIMCILIYMLYNTYFKKLSPEGRTTKSFLEQGLDTSNYQSILDSTRKTVKDINKQQLDRTNDLR